MASRLEKIVNNLRTNVVSKGSWDSIFLRNLEDKYMAGEEVMNDPYTKHDLVYICISTTQRAVSQVPIVVSERKITQGESGPEETFVPVPSEHPIQQLFDVSPNPLMDPYTFKEAIVGHYMLDGNVWVVPYPPGKKIPDALYVVSQKYMEPVRNRQTGQLDGWSYTPQGPKGRPIGLLAEEVLHFALWNPHDPIIGMSPLEAARLKIKTDYKAAIYNERFFDNGAVPQGVLQMDTRLSEDRYKRLQEQIDSKHKGYNRAHRMMILEEGLKYTQMGLSQRDMDYGELSRMSRESVLQCFGMKKSIISVIEDVNRATAESERKEWWKGTIIPMLRRFGFGFTQKVGVPFAGSASMCVDFDTSNVEALQADFAEKVSIAVQLSNIGFTSNEINRKLELGFDSREYRDKWWAPMSLVPVGDGDQDTGGVPEEESTLLKKPDEQEGIEEESFQTPECKGGDAPLWEKRAEAVWKSIVVNSNPTVTALERKVSRFFLDARKRALKHLMGGDGVQALEHEHFEEERERLARWVKPLFAKSVRMGLVSAKEELGDPVFRSAKEAVKPNMPTSMLPSMINPDFLLSDPLVIEYIERKTTQISSLDGLTKTMKRQISQQLALGAAAGESLDELAERVRAMFNLAAGRAKMIAKTEVFGAMNMGRDTAMKQTRFTKKVWYTAADERVRETHRAMNGKKTNMGDVWELHGGSFLRYPGDSEGGAPAGEVINCRCIVTIDASSHPDL